MQVLRGERFISRARGRCEIMLGEAMYGLCFTKIAPAVVWILDHGG